MERSIRLPLCLSHHATVAAARCGFAAERRASRRDRSTAAAAGRLAAAAPQQNGGRSAANAGSVTLTADVGS